MSPDINTDNENFQMWKFILSVSDAIASDTKHGHIKKTDLLIYLGTIEEAFEKANDPVGNFSGFAMLKLCRSLRKSLESMVLKDH